MSTRSLLVAGLVMTALATPVAAQQSSVSAEEIESLLFRQNVAALRSLQQPSASESTTQAVSRSGLEQAIAESRRAHARNRRLGNGLIGTGTAAVIASFASYLAGSSLSLNTQEHLLLVGGMGLAAWGTERYHTAQLALERAQRLQTYARSQ